MLENKLIIIPYNLPQQWICDYLEQTKKILIEKNFVFSILIDQSLSLKEIINNRIFYKRKFKLIEKSSRSIVYTPIHFIPLRRFKFIYKLNILINILIIKTIIGKIKKISKMKRILWLFGPKHNYLIGKFNENISIYDCVDFYSSMDKVENRRLIKDEERLMHKVDYVFVNSPVLYKLKRNMHSNLFLVPLGCDVSLFLKNNIGKQKPREFEKINQPRIGFVGNIDYRIDYDLIEKLVLRNSNWSFVFIGPTNNNSNQDRILKVRFKVNKLAQYKNVFFLGLKPKKQIPFYIDYFDICIIPYNTQLKFVRYSYPMKVFEYFSRGKPVISTPIESLILLRPLIKIACNVREFEYLVKETLKLGWSENNVKKQKKQSLSNSWAEKVTFVNEKLMDN